MKVLMMMVRKKLAIFFMCIFFLNNLKPVTINIDFDINSVNIKNIATLVLIAAVPILGIKANEQLEKDYIGHFFSSLPSGISLALANQLLDKGDSNVFLDSVRNTLTLYTFSYFKKNKAFEDFWDKTGKYLGIVNSTLAGEITKYLLLYKLIDSKSNIKFAHNIGALVGAITLAYSTLIEDKTPEDIRTDARKTCFVCT